MLFPQFLISVKTAYFIHWSLKQTKKPPTNKQMERDFLASFESVTISKEASDSVSLNLLSSLMSGGRSPVSKTV